ncbi:MAG: GDSL-type esterase/lipase family protein [Solobacterium sp.]|jgi:lysophospholipase L1-like esterase|nr:GDSL-type esterase/lipase family protein [Solobacterium sp.]MCH4265908.1 GDSL-type esterase/lipase family protein [Solobacterium sp.]
MDKPVRIACIGDSIVYGYGVEEHRDTEAWPSVLQKMLGSAFQVRNFGLCGTGAIAENGLPYWKTLRYRQSLLYQPEIVLILLGTNDARTDVWNEAAYQSGIQKMSSDYTALSSHPKIIYMLSPEVYPDAYGNVGFGISSELLDHEVHPAQKRLFPEDSIDLYSLFMDHRESFVDGVHPDREGNRMIANAAAARIRLLQKQE